VPQGTPELLKVDESMVETGMLRSRVRETDRPQVVQARGLPIEAIATREAGENEADPVPLTENRAKGKLPPIPRY
jgi:hypothetical protein